jgi:fructose transport system ATP-binding protein
MNTTQIVLQAKGLVKRYGQVTALDGADFELRAGEILAVIGDNGAGKSSLIKALSGATMPDEGEILLDGRRSTSRARSTPGARHRDGLPGPGGGAGHDHRREPVPRPRAARPGLPRQRAAHARQEEDAGAKRARMNDLKVGIRSMTQAVETLSGGQRQCVAVARAAAFARHVVIMDEPTAALGVKEGNMVLELIRRVRDKGLPVVLISHNMPHVFEIADRIHVARLGKRAAVLNPKNISMSDTVAVMTGAMSADAVAPGGAA